MEETIHHCLRKSIRKNKSVSIQAGTNKKRKFVHRYIISVCRIIDVDIMHRSIWKGSNNYIKGKQHNSVEIIPKKLFIDTIYDITNIIDDVILLIIQYQDFNVSKKKNY